MAKAMSGRLGTDNNITQTTESLFRKDSISCLKRLGKNEVEWTEEAEVRKSELCPKAKQGKLHSDRALCLTEEPFDCSRPSAEGTFISAIAMITT